MKKTGKKTCYHWDNQKNSDNLNNHNIHETIKESISNGTESEGEKRFYKERPMQKILSNKQQFAIKGEIKA